MHNLFLGTCDPVVAVQIFASFLHGNGPQLHPQILSTSKHHSRPHVSPNRTNILDPSGPVHFANQQIALRIVSRTSYSQMPRFYSPLVERPILHFFLIEPPETFITDLHLRVPHSTSWS